MRNHLRLVLVWLLVLIGAVHLPGWVSPSPGARVFAQSTPTATRVRATPTRSCATPQASPTRRTTVPTPTVAVTDVLKAYFLDVDQGDSILLDGPDFTILVDAGRHDREDVVPQLEEIGVESIDLLVGTHPHADHIGQFPEVLERFPVGEVWMSGDINTTRTFENAIDAVADSGVGYHEPRAGEVFQIGSARIEVLNPTRLTGEPNEDSIVFRLIFGDVAFMFTGDAEAPTEREILESGRDLHAQILKMGHHGSDTSSSLAFLLAVEPDIAIWSAGFENTYGHPHAVTMERLERLGVTLVGTIDHGTIVVWTDGERYHVEDHEPNEQATATPAPTPTLTPLPDRSGCAPGQVNINTASLEQLVLITQVGPARAQLIIEQRPFNTLDDLDRISGITPATVAKIEAQGLACVD